MSLSSRSLPAASVPTLRPTSRAAPSSCSTSSPTAAHGWETTRPTRSGSSSPIRSLSAGQKKKVALCSALVAETPVLLLDEPFSGGLDPAGIMTLKRIIQHHQRRKEATIVLTSPVPELVEEIQRRAAGVGSAA